MKRFVGIVISLCAFFPATPSYAQPARLIGWWKLDDATNATVLADSSGFGRNAAKGPGVSLVDGRFGKAARFDGTTNAWASFSNPLLTNMTIAAWVYVDGIPQNILPRIMQIGPDTYYLMPSNGLGQFSLGVQSNGWGTGTTDVKFSLNKWFHAAVVYREEYTNATERVVSAVFYLNGIRIGDPTGAKTVFKRAIPAGTSFIGNNSTGIGAIRPLNGMMDDVRLYDAPLSDRDVFALYQNLLPAVDAGKDQACYRAETRLQGRLASLSTFTRSLTVRTAWSVVSSPGGASPVLQTPWLPATPVTLPDAGTYTFRLTASNELGAVSDDVTVTRYTGGAPAGNIAPTVSPLWPSTNTILGIGAPLSATVADDGKPTNTTRVCWSKVSGPGAVFFDNAFTNTTTAYFSTNGTYVVRLEADDGDLAQSSTITVTVSAPTGNLSAGLLHWWRMDDDPGLKKTFDSAGTNTVSLFSQAVLQPGKTGYGLRTPAYNAYAQAAALPTNAETMTFATWLYYDNGFTNNPTMRIFFCGENFRILYNRDLNQIDFATTYVGGAPSNTVNWAFSNAKLTTNQWFHIAALIDRRAATSNQLQTLYLNGKPSLSGKYSFAYPSLGTTNFPGAAPFISPFLLGNNATTGTRNFDGVLDEMRVYNRFLTDEEIRLLAVDPDNNHAPVIEGPANLTAKVGQPVSLPRVITDDGQPLGNTVTAAWSVEAGDAAKVSLADPSKADSSATFTRTGEYVLTLSVSDGEQGAANSVRVTVLPTGTVLLLL